MVAATAVASPAQPITPATITGSFDDIDEAKADVAASKPERGVMSFDVVDDSGEGLLLR